MSVKEIRRKMKANRGSMKRAAERAGVTKQFVSQVLGGDDPPAAHIVQACLETLEEKRRGNHNSQS